MSSDRISPERGDGSAASVGCENTLRRLAVSGEPATEPCGLDDKSVALVRLGALVALDAPPMSYRRTTKMALGAGATVDELVGTLIAVAPAVGLARLVSATPCLAVAAGYDIDSALENPEV